MNKILSNIRAVPGVYGTIVIDKNRALTYQLLPASFSAETVKDMAILTLNLSQSSDKPFVIDLFFESGKARIYNRGEVAALIVGREEMNFDILGEVCKEALHAVSRRFSRGNLTDTIQPQKFNSTGASFELLLKAINIIAYNAQQKIGSYLVTKHLRSAKDSLVDKYEFLTSITVDNNGVASLIKGSPSYKGDNLLKAFAHWANLFVSNCASSTDKLKPEDIIQLTTEIRSRLEMTGFYQLYTNVGAAN